MVVGFCQMKKFLIKTSDEPTKGWFWNHRGRAGPHIPEYGNDYTECQICFGGPGHFEMESPIMSSPFCNDCREKEKQQNNQQDSPRGEGSSKHENNGGSSKRSPHDSQACEVCWGGPNHNDVESPLMSSPFCDGCRGSLSF